MVNLAALLLLVVFTVGIILLIRRSIFTQKRSDLLALAGAGTAEERADALAVLRSLRARNLCVFVVLAATGAVAAALHGVFPGAAGLPLAVAPAGMWVAAAVVFACWPLPHEFSDTSAGAPATVSADLAPRSASMFGPAWGVALPAVLLAVTVLGLVVAGTLSGPDENGRFRNLPYVSSAAAELDSNMVVTAVQLGEGSAGPFPGWYYGVPTLVLLLLGAVLSLWALNANVRRPRMRGEHLRGFDDAVRTNVGYVVSTGFSAMVCFQGAPLMMFAAAAFRSAGTNPAYEVGQVQDEAGTAGLAVDPVMGVLSLSLAVAALVLLVIGAILLLRLVGWLGAAVRPLRVRGAEVASA